MNDEINQDNVTAASQRILAHLEDMPMEDFTNDEWVCAFANLAKAAAYDAGVSIIQEDEHSTIEITLKVPLP